MHSLHDDEYYPGNRIEHHTSVGKFEELKISPDSPDDGEHYTHAHQSECEVRASQTRNMHKNGRHDAGEANGVNPRIYSRRWVICGQL